MPESAYKIIELIGTSKESWEKGRIRGGQPRRKIPARPPCRRDRQARSATRRQGRGRGVPRQGERLVQVRGLKAIPRHCELEPSLGAKAPSVDERSHHRSPNPGDGFFLSRNDLNNLSIAHFLILSVAHACLMGLRGSWFRNAAAASRLPVAALDQGEVPAASCVQPDVGWGPNWGLVWHVQK